MLFARGHIGSSGFDAQTSTALLKMKPMDRGPILLLPKGPLTKPYTTQQFE